MLQTIGVSKPEVDAIINEFKEMYMDDSLTFLESLNIRLPPTRLTPSSSGEGTGTPVEGESAVLEVGDEEDEERNGDEVGEMGKDEIESSAGVGYVTVGGGVRKEEDVEDIGYEVERVGEGEDHRGVVGLSFPNGEMIVPRAQEEETEDYSSVRGGYPEEVVSVGVDSFKLDEVQENAG